MARPRPAGDARGEVGGVGRRAGHADGDVGAACGRRAGHADGAAEGRQLLRPFGIGFGVDLGRGPVGFRALERLARPSDGSLPETSTLTIVGRGLPAPCRL